jgi:uncharacterized protein YjbI with pentapeptide repeats
MDLASFRFGTFKTVVFTDCKLLQADFQAADLRGARFERCDLTGAQFSKAQMEGTRFSVMLPTDVLGDRTRKSLSVD